MYRTNLTKQQAAEQLEVDGGWVWAESDGTYTLMDTEFLLGRMAGDPDEKERIMWALHEDEMFWVDACVLEDYGYSFDLGKD